MKTAKEWVNLWGTESSQAKSAGIKARPVVEWIAEIQRDVLEHLKPHLDTPLSCRDKLYNEVIQQIEKGKE